MDMVHQMEWVLTIMLLVGGGATGSSSPRNYVYEWPSFATEAACQKARASILQQLQDQGPTDVVRGACFEKNKP